ncbi:MAG: AAA family ATPase, partial [Patescibacteria group bacterium]|nr:AAA family ATPase [Patescibacteria group bacterium]
MTKLVITRGLPASGKTTWARAWVAEDPEARTRVNRDDLRWNLFGKYWPLTYKQEEAVTKAQKSAVEALLRGGISVVVDDTHLRLAHARAWADLAQKLDVDFDYVDFTDVHITDCIARDKDREARGERSVGYEAIKSMHDKFLAKGPLPHPTSTEKTIVSTNYRYEPHTSTFMAWMVDIDGTLAKMNGRGPFEWHRVGEDEPVPQVASMVRALCAYDYRIVVMSGRDSVCRRETEQWLWDNDIPFDLLVMRPEGDNRKDAVVKLELFQKHVAPYYNVVGVLDDRQQVVDMWR